MDTRLTLFQELTSFLEKHFKHRDHFSCVYGSYASKHHTDKSDMDMFIAMEAVEDGDLERTKDFLIDLHVRHGLSLDDEVPYENKLIVSYEDVRNALDLLSFVKVGARYRIPPIEKEEKFLASPEVRWRLILNALTSPHEFIYGNQETYADFKVGAERAIVRLARGLTKDDTPTPTELLESLFSGVNGEEGEMYLGYKKERDEIVRYLKNIIVEYHRTEKYG